MNIMIGSFRIFSIPSAFLLTILLSTQQVIAQPQPARPQHQVAPQRRIEVPPDTPKDAIEMLAYAFNLTTVIRDAAGRIVGANPDDPALKELGEEFTKARGTFALSVGEFEGEAKDDEATVTFRAALRDHLGNQMAQQESLQLRRQEPRPGAMQGDIWLVVPGDPATVLSNKDTKAGFLLRLATYIAYPQQALNVSRATASSTHVKWLALGMMQLLQDHDKKFALTSGTFRKDMAPYVDGDDIFYAPGDRSGEIGYLFNDNLAGLTLDAIPKPAETVMVYEGRNGQLNFRYNGRGVVGFADGHVALVSMDDAKALRWNP
jgi:prepilin-type processing-associated H-X9-DG protein